MDKSKKEYQELRNAVSINIRNLESTIARVKKDFVNQIEKLEIRLKNEEMLLEVVEMYIREL